MPEYLDKTEHTDGGDRLDAVWWGLIFIWGALILLAENAGWSDQWSWWNGWGVFFVGAGALALLGTLLRLQMPAYRKRWVTSLIFGVIFLAIGFGAWQAGGWLWVLALLIVGVAILVSAFRQQTR